ncbi:MAG: ABC transporter ATP-binding protein [Candidatus Abyssobacteria bacterium SURF_17]|uniref:ABC transporter ATP-binding protein n=1 Tax=Candidatus Abyssobacteria bacterium SURF_17 TaxID=2093361 RepID=A0A419EXF4_9BACT|nr:MAG: ABC transporter ATP-binding protein [Candidatus Abyssubacteria bacterium SURF_17]
MRPVLETEHLRVVFKGSSGQKKIVAVDDLSLRVNQGEVVGFIGPNGAGKTTTIKVLMGFIFPTSGKAKVLGYEAGSKMAKSRTGYLPEVALYYPFMTAEEILRLYGRLQGIGKKELSELIPRLISRAGLSGFEQLRLKNFSRGMLQRVGLAQAIMGDPDLLVLDEVTSGLDPVGRRDLRNILKDFRSRGKTVFFSSHELSEVAKLCDRVILIDEGRVIQEKSMQEILEMEGKQGSLEDYFVEVVGHKVT